MLEQPFISNLESAHSNDDVLPIRDVETIIQANRVEDLWEFLSGWLDNLGFSRVIYGFTQFKSTNSLGDPRDLMVLTNFPAEYVEQFIDGRMFFDGPMVRWASENVGAMSWRMIGERVARGELTSNEMKVVELNRQFQLTAGYTISFNGSSSRAKAAIGLVPDLGQTQDFADEIWARHGSKVQAMCNIANLQLINLPYVRKDRKLTSRQREVLEWVGEGKTTQDIATILGLTAATVEKHLRRARDVLDVDTTAQAVLKASFYNQIFVM